MTTMVDLFSAQMFLWGWVHCDPHPGNILLLEGDLICFLDFGLYGFALDTVGKPVSVWPQLCEAWLRQVGFL